jgi:hypothetical protein
VYPALQAPVQHHEVLREIADRCAIRLVNKFLKDLHAGNPLAIYSLAGPIVKVIHEFSDNTASLINCRDRGAGLVSQLLGSEAADGHIKAEWTLAAMESIALHLADIQGRKTLIWIINAFPMTLGFYAFGRFGKRGLCHTSRRKDW